MGDVQQIFAVWLVKFFLLSGAGLWLVHRLLRTWRLRAVPQPVRGGWRGARRSP